VTSVLIIPSPHSNDEATHIDTFGLGQTSNSVRNHNRQSHRNLCSLVVVSLIPVDLLLEARSVEAGPRTWVVGV